MSAPTIQTVKGRVVFFRTGREKISTLKPLTPRPDLSQGTEWNVTQ